VNSGASGSGSSDTNGSQYLVLIIIIVLFTIIVVVVVIARRHLPDKNRTTPEVPHRDHAPDSLEAVVLHNKAMEDLWATGGEPGVAWDDTMLFNDGPSHNVTKNAWMPFKGQPILDVSEV
jgi:hypothetical protein